jgi:hypothetical protein
MFRMKRNPDVSLLFKARLGMGGFHEVKGVTMLGRNVSASINTHYRPKLARRCGGNYGNGRRSKGQQWAGKGVKGHEFETREESRSSTSCYPNGRWPRYSRASRPAPPRMNPNCLGREVHTSRIVGK